MNKKQYIPENEFLPRPSIHQSLNLKRLEYDPDDLENIFHDEWIEQNETWHTLEVICRQDGFEITERDAMVAATVIQWLGTNCGYAFLHKCFREEEHRAAMAKQLRLEERNELEKEVKVFAENILKDLSSCTSSLEKTPAFENHK